MQYNKTPIGIEKSKNTNDFLIALTGTNKKVLGIGPSFRQISKILKERGCKNTLIDLNSEECDLENGIEHTILGNIESLDLRKEIGPEKFDAILLCNFLECVRNPTELLKQLREFLSYNGNIICCVSNISYISIRIKLLNGEFRYTTDIILNENQIRFFTLDTILRMAKEAKYSFTSLHRVMTEFDLFNCSDLNYNTIPQELVEAILKDPESTTINYVFSIVPTSNAKSDNLIWSMEFPKDITTERLKEIFHYYKENVVEVLEQKIKERESQIIQLQASSNKFKKIVNDVYIEILQRNSDLQGLEHYAYLLERGKITREELRRILLESEEYKSLNKNIPK